MRFPAKHSDALDDQPDAEAADGLQIREVAALLGISRSRVIQIEQQAMAKLKARLAYSGADSPDDFTDSISLPKACGSTRANAPTQDDDAWRESLFAGPGWLKADQIVCTNDNNETDPSDIALSFAFLSGQRRNEKLVRIPVIAAGTTQVRVVGHVNGVNAVNSSLRIHVTSATANLNDEIDLSACRVTAITETHSGSDGHGSFCVPVLVSVIASLPGSVPKPMRDYIRLAKTC
jgi:hypothetical protein